MDADLTREGLLTAILSWYANPGTWEARSNPVLYSSGSSCRATMDAGRVARAAVSAGSAGALLTALCDAHSVALTALARTAGIPDSRMGEIARGSDPDAGERARIAAALKELAAC